MTIPISLPIDLQILLVLFEKHQLNKRALDTHTGLHPKTTQKYLESLVRQKFVHEQGDHKRGKKIFYDLTPKGQEYLIEQMIDNLNPVFAAIQKVAGIIASKPSALKQFREFLKENPPSIVTPEMSERGYSTKEEIKRDMENVERTHGPLREAYKAMRKTYLEVWGPRGSNGELLDVAIALTKEGYVYLIQVALLKTHGLGVGL